MDKELLKSDSWTASRDGRPVTIYSVDYNPETFRYRILLENTAQHEKNMSTTNRMRRAKGTRYSKKQIRVLFKLRMKLLLEDGFRQECVNSGQFIGNVSGMTF